MEDQLEKDIRKFLAVNNGSGSGSGSGSGDGYGDGYGSGYGSGDGSGSGDGYGSGYGSGSGSGSGISEYNGQKVYMIDGIATLIDSVHQIYAKGKIIRDDMIVVPCYIARVGDSFAHGATLRKAMADARAKDMESKPLKIRIAEFRKTYPDADKKIPASELYGWHHILTGSCEMGRKQFANAHGIDIDGDSMTVKEFVSLTSHAYGSDAIRKLAETYGIDTKGL